MTEFTANFELGTNGNTIATTDPGSLTAWNAVTGAPKYDNTQFAHGAQSAKFTAQNQFVAWTGLGNVTDHYGRVYVYLGIFNGGFPRFLTINDSSGVLRAEILLDNARKLIIEDSGETHNQTGTVALSLSTWYRIEYHVIHSATVGQIEVKLFLGDSTSAIDTITSPASWDTGASADQFKFGFVASGTVGDVFYGDDIVANATNYPGPFEFTATFEAGINGNAISTASAEASATAWTRIFGTQTYSNTHVAHGSLACLRPSAFDNFGLIWDKSYATDFYGRFYLYATANPSAAVDLARITGGGVVSRLVLRTDGKLDSLVGSDHVVGAVAIALNQWVRIEYHFTASATVGLFELKLFNTKESTSPSETLGSTANRNTGASAPNEVDFSGGGAWGADAWFDTFVTNATSYPGPVTSGSLYTILNGSNEPLLNVNAGGTDVDALSYKNAVLLTQDELTALLDGSSFGKKNVGVMPDLTDAASANPAKMTVATAADFPST